MKKIILLILLFPILSFADWVDDMQYLQTEWAKVKYQLDSSDQQKGFETLLEQADLRLKNNPNQAELLIWHAIVEASYAGSLSAINPTALGYVKNAKKRFRKSY